MPHFISCILFEKVVVTLTYEAHLVADCVQFITWRRIITYSHSNCLSRVALHRKSHLHYLYCINKTHIQA